MADTRSASDRSSCELAPAAEAGAESDADVRKSGSGRASSRGVEAPVREESPASQARAQGTACYKKAEYREAFDHYTDALSHRSEDVAVLGNRCAAALMLKRYASARQDATLILQHDKENVRACTRLAKACLGCGDIASAVAWAQEAAQREPGSAQVRTELAKMQRAQAELQSAEASLARGDGAAAAASARRVHALFPDMTIEVAEIVLVQALLQQNQGAEALKASRDVLAANSSSSAARTVHAQALIATGNIPRALTLCQQMMQSDPDNTQLAKAFKRAKALDGGRVTGNAAFKSGDFQAAYDAYSKSLDAGAGLQNTFVAQVATNRAQTCLKLRRISEAIADAERAIAADERFAKAYLRRAQAYELQEEWQAAVRDFTKVQELDDKFPGIAEHVKRAKLELKKSKRVDYYKLLEVDQNAGDAEIKKAYKRAALKCHPDKVAEGERDAAEKRFKQLVEANAILTDSEKRRRYDAGWSGEEIDQGFQEGHACRGGADFGMGPGMEEMLFAAMFQQHQQRGGGRRGGGFGFG